MGYRVKQINRDYFVVTECDPTPSATEYLTDPQGEYILDPQGNKIPIPN